MPRPKSKRVGDPNRQKVKGHRGVPCEAMRAVHLQRKTPEGQAERAVSFDPGAVRAAIEAQLCPFCGRGPYKVLAVHTCKAHGIDRRELRELAGLNGSARICSPEFSERAKELATERDFGAIGASVDRSSRPAKYKMTSAGRAALAQNLIDYTDRLGPDAASQQRRDAARIAGEQRSRRAKQRGTEGRKP